MDDHPLGGKWFFHGILHHTNGESVSYLEIVKQITLSFLLCKSDMEECHLKYVYSVVLGLLPREWSWSETYRGWAGGVVLVRVVVGNRGWMYNDTLYIVHA